MKAKTLEVKNVGDFFVAENYSFSVDWLNCRLDCDNLGLVISKLCATFPTLEVSDFVNRPSGGVCFYTRAVYLEKCGYSSVVLSYCTDDNGNIINECAGRGILYGILVSVSGDGCRYLNSLRDNGMYHFIKALEPFNPHCSRIDMAMDIYDSNNILVPILQKFCDNAYCEDKEIDFNCGLHRRPGWVTANLVFDKNVNDFTRNITIGGRDCKKGTLQLYNKRVEVETGRLSSCSEYILNSVGDPDYWWRLEYRCKSFAQSVFDTLLTTGSVYTAYLCAVKSMGEFCVPVGVNISQSLDCVDWVLFLNFLDELSTGEISISRNSSIVQTPYVNCVLEKVRNYHLNNIASNDTIHYLMLFLDKDYRKQVYGRMLSHLCRNGKLAPALDELRLRYGFKLEENLDFMFEQLHMDDIA